MRYLEFIELLAGSLTQRSDRGQSEVQELSISTVERADLVESEKDIKRIVTKECELSVVLHPLVGYLQCGI